MRKPPAEHHLYPRFFLEGTKEFVGVRAEYARQSEAVREVTDDDRRRFADQYAQFKQTCPIGQCMRATLMADIKNDLGREISGVKDHITGLVGELKGELSKAKDMMSDNVGQLKQKAKGVQNLASALGELNGEFDDFFGGSNSANATLDELNNKA